MSDQRTSFGNASKEYDLYRKGYPLEVFSYILSFLPAATPIKILDIGCGTGISTRGIKQTMGNRADVVGSDIDKRMIQEARKHTHDISYDISPAEKLIYPENSFDLITAFGSFHWFTNQDALLEIKRVLKASGYFAVVNKTDVGNFKKDIKELVSEYKGYTEKSIKDDYDPVKSLGDAGFDVLDKRSFYVTESFGVQEAIGMYKSTSLYSLVPDNKKESFLSDLEQKISNRLIEGKTQRELSIDVVIASFL